MVEQQAYGEVRYPNDFPKFLDTLVPTWLVCFIHE